MGPYPLALLAEPDPYDIARHGNAAPFLPNTEETAVAA
jgi:hypothetical protein